MLRNQSPIFVPKLLPVDIVTIEEEPLLLRYGLRVSFNERDEISLRSRLRWIKECNDKSQDNACLQDRNAINDAMNDCIQTTKTGAAVEQTNSDS